MHLPDSLSTLAFVFAVFILAGLVKGLVGLGLPTVAMGLLASLLAPAQAAALLILPSLLTNLWQMWDGPALRRLLRRLWPLQLGAVIGTLWAPVSLVSLDPRLAAAALGVALIAYALFGLVAPRLALSARGERLSAGPTGIATGAVTAATGVFAFPAVAWLQALGLPKNELVQALGLSFTVSTLALAARLALDGSLVPGQWPGGWLLLAPLPAALLGMAAGQALRGRLDETSFKRLFFLGLLVIGLAMLLR